MRAGHAAVQAEPVAVVGQGFDVARQRVVRFVAVHVHPQALPGREFAQDAHRFGTVGHGALEVGDAAHHVHAQGDGALQVGQRGGAAQQAVLREGHQLHVQVRRHAALHFQQRFHGQQAVVAHVHMGADSQQAARHGPVAIAHGALDQRVLGQLRLQFAPQRDAFE